MICPNCKNNTIPFLRVWLAGEFGRFACPHCAARCRVRRSLLHCAISGGLGCLAVLLGLLFSSWKVFAVAIAAVLALDALKDHRFRQLEMTGQAPDRPPKA